MFWTCEALQWSGGCTRGWGEFFHLHTTTAEKSCLGDSLVWKSSPDTTEETSVPKCTNLAFWLKFFKQVSPYYNQDTNKTWIITLECLEVVPGVRTTISNRLSNHEVGLTNVGNVFQEKGQIVVISNNLSSHTVHRHLCAESEKKHFEEPYYHRKNSVKLRLSVLTKKGCQRTYFLRKSIMSSLLIFAASSCTVRQINFTSWTANHIYHPAQPPACISPGFLGTPQRPVSSSQMNSASRHTDPLFPAGWTQMRPSPWRNKWDFIS